MYRGIVLCALFAVVVLAAEQFPSREYGYINISSTYNSQMFYALAGDKDLNATGRAALPLVIYLQGGPGASSLFGDLLENGPEKLEKSSTASSGYTTTKRVHSWTKHANMLWIDNPIGTGFSYTDEMGYATTDDGIAQGLVTFTQGFLAKHPEYVTSPLWIFCESYGGKMTAYFGAALQKALTQKKLTANFKGVAIGDGWVDPIACMKSYGPYLHTFSQVTEEQSKNVTRYAEFAQDALERGDGVAATNWWGRQQSWISNYSDNVNWYNVLYYYDYTASSALGPYIRNVLQPSLGKLIPSSVEYKSESLTVFNKLMGTFMIDGVKQVQEMIDAGLSVNVYGGQVDLIVDTLCIQQWMKKLPWSDIGTFLNQPRTPLYAANKKSNVVGGFVQKYKNLAFWQINQAGHMVPLDQPAVAETMLVNIIGGDMKKVNPVDQDRKMPPKGKAAVIHMRKPWKV